MGSDLTPLPSLVQGFGLLVFIVGLQLDSSDDKRGATKMITDMGLFKLSLVNFRPTTYICKAARFPDSAFTRSNTAQILTALNK